VETVRIQQAQTSSIVVKLNLWEDPVWEDLVAVPLNHEDVLPVSDLPSQVASLIAIEVDEVVLAEWRIDQQGVQWAAKDELAGALADMYPRSAYSADRDQLIRDHDRRFR
jgi:hypothetical protein